MEPIWYHLLDSATNTHYANGGFIDPLMAPVPFDGAEWVEGRPANDAPLWVEIDPLSAAIAAARVLIMTLPVESRAAHYTKVSDILSALEQHDFETALYMLQNTITPANQTEADILASVQEIFAGF